MKTDILFRGLEQFCDLLLGKLYTLILQPDFNLNR